MKYKAVICDLDGTLLNESYEISEKTREVIKKVTEQGIKFIIATGRHHNDAKVYKEILKSESFLITSNGAKVHNPENKEIISHNIPKELSEKLLSFTYHEELHKNIYSDEKWYAESPLEMAEQFHKESGFMYEISSFESLRGKEVTKFFFLSENQKIMSSLEKDLKENFGLKLNITLSFSSCIEVMKDGISKATAIEEVLKMENIHPDETIAFGDGLNDFEMLSLVKKGYIMGNGSERLKELLPSNEVIERNSNDGVAKKLEELFLTKI